MCYIGYMKGAIFMADSNNTTYAIIEVFIKIAQYIVDLILALANGGEIKLPDFGDLLTK